MTNEQSEILQGYLTSNSIVRTIEYPSDTDGSFKIVSECHGFRFVDHVTPDGQTRVESSTELEDGQKWRD